jgi:hypothetical protein
MRDRDHAREGREMTMVQCMKCGWADIALSEFDAEAKVEGHKVKTGCDGQVLVANGRKP